jgi:DNA-binding response OmpR family regulator
MPVVSAPRTARPQIAGSGKRVLVVDDNRDAADMIGLFLSNAGHDVRVAHDPLQALSSVDVFRPQIAIVDIGLPVMDGLELARRVRLRPQRGDVYMVALTGYGQQADRVAALDAGFDAHVVKPLDLEELTRLMHAQPR